ncbi:MAG TPA: hypothetical protein PLM89_03585, partial [Anaerolineales bacterium]|nr:hypothetical protein [Anaerolineales bacterium]
MTLLSIIAIGGSILLVLLIIGAVATVLNERSLVEERLGRFLDDEKPAANAKEKEDTLVTEWLNRRVARSESGGRVARELADRDRRPVD